MADRSPTLNFHHLRYFRAVALDGTLTRAAKRLRVAQSALSTQIRQLEEALDERLFERRARRLVLTEAGQVALTHAEEIFAAGERLVATLQTRRRDDALRIGAVATLSRNFLESFLGPLLRERSIRLGVVSATLDELLAALTDLRLDLVLSNRPPAGPRAAGLRSRRLARQSVSIVGPPREGRGLRFPAALDHAPLVLPSPDDPVRVEFEALCEQLGVTPRVVAEVDDRATLRLLARDSGHLALVPPVVVRDELDGRRLVEHWAVPGLFETFYCITVDRRFAHPLVASLLAQDAADLLAAAPSHVADAPHGTEHRPTRPRRSSKTRK